MSAPKGWSRPGSGHGEAAVQVLIELPAPLREYAGGGATVTVDATTVGEALAALTGRFPRLRRHLYDDAGRIRGYVNLYVNEEPVPGTRDDATPLTHGDTLVIVPSVSGGNGDTPINVAAGRDHRRRQPGMEQGEPTG